MYTGVLVGHFWNPGSHLNTPLSSTDDDVCRKHPILWKTNSTPVYIESPVTGNFHNSGVKSGILLVRPPWTNTHHIQRWGGSKGGE